MSPAAAGQGNPARASLWFGAALYFNSGLLLLATPIFTRLLSISEYGEVVLYNSAAVVIGIFATLSLSAGTYQRALLEFADDLDGYIASMIGLSTLCVIICFCILYAFSYFAGDVVGLRPSLFGFMFVWFIFNSTLTFWQKRERFFYRYRLMVPISIASSAIGIFCAVALVALVPSHRVESRVIAAAAPAVLVGLILYFVLLARGKQFYSKRYWRYALAQNIPLLPHYLSQAFILQFDRFVIERASSKADVGIYGVAYAVVAGVMLLGQAINTTWIPWTFKKLHQRLFDDIAARAGELMCIIAVACILGALAAPEIVALLAPKLYKTAAEIVPLLLLSTYINFAQSIFLNVQFFHKRSVAITWCSVLGALINISGNLLFVPIFGLMAAAYVFAATQLFLLSAHYTVARSRDKSRIVDGRFLIGLSCGTAALIAIAMLVQQTFALRWALFLIVATVASLAAAARLRRARQRRLG